MAPYDDPCSQTLPIPAIRCDSNRDECELLKSAISFPVLNKWTETRARQLAIRLYRPNDKRHKNKELMQLSFLVYWNHSIQLPKQLHKHVTVDFNQGYAPGLRLAHSWANQLPTRKTQMLTQDESYIYFHWIIGYTVCHHLL